MRLNRVRFVNFNFSTADFRERTKLSTVNEGLFWVSIYPTFVRNKVQVKNRTILDSWSRYRYLARRVKFTELRTDSSQRAGYTDPIRFCLRSPVSERKRKEMVLSLSHRITARRGRGDARHIGHNHDALAGRRTLSVKGGGAVGAAALTHRRVGAGESNPLN